MQFTVTRKPKKSKNILLCFALVSLLSCAPLLLADARAADVQGAAQVLDGDTLRISGEKVRFVQMDAPETKQQCKDANGDIYPCGRVATMRLRERIGSAKIRCVEEGKSRDRYDRILGRCFFPNGDDIGAWMVREGWALAYRRYGTDYIDEEEMAREEKRGMWNGRFVPPWEWRRGERLQ